MTMYMITRHHVVVSKASVCRELAKAKRRIRGTRPEGTSFPGSFGHPGSKASKNQTAYSSWNRYRFFLLVPSVRTDVHLARFHSAPGRRNRSWNRSKLLDWAGIVKDRQSDLVPTSEVVPRIRRLVFRNRSEPKSPEGTRPPRGTRPVPSGLVPRIRRLALAV